MKCLVTCHFSLSSFNNIFILQQISIKKSGSFSKMDIFKMSKIEKPKDFLKKGSKKWVSNHNALNFEIL